VYLYPSKEYLLPEPTTTLKLKLSSEQLTSTHLQAISHKFNSLFDTLRENVYLTACLNIYCSARWGFHLFKDLIITQLFSSQMDSKVREILYIYGIPSGRMFKGPCALLLELDISGTYMAGYRKPCSSGAKTRSG